MLRGAYAIVPCGRFISTLASGPYSTKFCAKQNTVAAKSA